MLAGMIVRPRATSLADQFRGKLLALATYCHLLGDHALAGVVHLREVPRPVVRCSVPLGVRSCPLFDPRIPQRHKVPRSAADAAQRLEIPLHYRTASRKRQLKLRLP